MTKITSPTHPIEHSERIKECENLCEALIAEIICIAVQAGWREKEVALCFADAADDFVLNLAAPRRMQ